MGAGGRIVFVMLGKKDFLSGGYIFNSKMVEHLRASGHHVDVIHFRTVPQGLPDNWLKASRYIRRRILEAHPDLVIVGKSYQYMPLFRLSPACRRIPVLYLMHHLEWMDIGNKFKARLYRMYVGWLLGMADMIWANSDSTGRALNEMGISPDTVKVISPGFHRVPVKESPEGAEAETLRILSVGSLCPRKDQMTLIRACALLEDLDFHLDLVGSTDACPDYAAAVSELLEEFDLHGKVSIIGNLDRSGMDEIYSRSRILVHPALWEAFGMAVLEGMWHGLPVVAADTAAIPELVRNGENGLLFQPGNEIDLADALRRLMTDEDMRVAMGGRSRELAQGMNDWKETGNEFEELVEDLLQGSVS